MAKLEIKLVKSTIGRLEKHQRTVEALGLRKVGQVVVKEANPAIKRVWLIQLILCLK